MRKFTEMKRKNLSTFTQKQFYSGKGSHRIGTLYFVDEKLRVDQNLLI